MSYHVVRSTTEKLDRDLNAIPQTPYLTQWVGGRDWILIYSDATMVGWVEDQDARHAKFDASFYARPVETALPDVGPEAFTHLIDPEVEWGDIRYGRYDTERVPTGPNFVGWIEDRARSWIIFLGEHGAPALYWPRRDAEGGVIGKAIDLSS